MKSFQNSTLSEKAAECFLALEVEPSEPRTRLRWRAWLSENPEHRRAFETCRDAWTASAALKIARPSEADLAADRYRGETPVAQSFGPRPAARPWQISCPPTSRPFRVPRGAWMTSAAAALLVVAIAIGRHQPADDHRPIPVVYETGRGEQKQMTLPDGSAITMGPEARLEALLLPERRTFHLTAGEAIFTAAHDPARPFRVYVGSGWVDDIGTAFDIRSEANQVTVTVIQGEVEVDTPALADGGRAAQPAVRTRLSRDQQISFAETQGPVHAVDAQQATAWHTGQLAYVDQPLERVIADLRRYSLKDIVVQDPAIGALRYSGTVSIDELDHWASGLARVYPVQIRILSDRLILSTKHQDR